MLWRVYGSQKVAGAPTPGRAGKSVDVLVGRKPAGKSSHATDNANRSYENIFSSEKIERCESMGKREGVGPNRLAGDRVRTCHA